MSQWRSAEELIAALNAVIEEFRQVASGSGTADSRAALRETAIDKIKALGFTLADAERWLDAALRKGRR